MKNSEVKSSAVLVIFSLFFLYMTIYIPITEVSRIGSALFPRIVLSVVLLLSLCNLFTNLKKEGEKDTDKWNFKYVTVFVTLLIVSMFVINIFGFLIGSTFFFTLGSYFMLEQKKTVNIIKMLVFGFVFSLIINYVFADLLQLTLPAGQFL